MFFNKNEYLISQDAINQAQNKEDKIIAKIYSIYEKELIRLNCCDFGNLILHCLNIFKKDKSILVYYQNQFKYILVDEYQDINFVQQQWLKYLFVNLLGGIANYTVFVFLVGLQINVLLSLILSTSVGFIFNFNLSKKFIFNRKFCTKK